jgi:hypothetical protein
MTKRQLVQPALDMRGNILPHYFDVADLERRRFYTVFTNSRQRWRCWRKAGNRPECSESLNGDCDHIRAVRLYLRSEQ